MADLPPRQIVRLTRCLDVRGHPATLIEMMSYVGYRWYPEYTVKEQFHDFNQTQYHCIVRIYPHHNGVTQPIHFGHGIGMTENMAVQDAAYSLSGEWYPGRVIQEKGIFQDKAVADWAAAGPS